MTDPTPCDPVHQQMLANERARMIPTQHRPGQPIPRDTPPPDGPVDIGLPGPFFTESNWRTWPAWLTAGVTVTFGIEIAALLRDSWPLAFYGLGAMFLYGTLTPVALRWARDSRSGR